jgi:hypothetical protein
MASLDAPAGLKGLLALLGASLCIGLAVTIVRFCADLQIIHDYVLMRGFPKPTILVALLGSLGLLTFNVFVVAVFFQKKRWFPLLFYIFAITNALAPMVLVFAASFGAGSALTLQAAKEHGLSVLIFAVWAVYIRLSSRVRATFTH